jgi:hypothetical protein
MGTCCVIKNKRVQDIRLHQLQMNPIVNVNTEVNPIKEKEKIPKQLIEIRSKIEQSAIKVK